MKKFVVTGLAVAALGAFGAAPASAQVDTSPPCTPTVPVPTAVNCTFDIAVWGVTEAQKLPATAIATAQAAANNAIRTAQGAVTQYGTVVDNAEREAIETTCWVLYGTRECPSR